MRSYPHHPDEAMLQEQLDETRREYQAAVTAGTGKSTLETAEHLWREALSLAALEYGLSASSEVVTRYLEMACDHAEVVLQEGGPTGTNYYRIQLAIANLLHRAKLRTQLEGIQRDALAIPHTLADELDLLTAEIMADLSAGRDAAAAARIALAEARSADNGLPPHIRDLFVPLVRIEAAILRKDSRTLLDGLNEHIESHRRWYSDEHSRQFPFSLLDFTGLGLATLAHQRGLRVDARSVYLPLDYL